MKFNSNSSEQTKKIAAEFSKKLKKGMVVGLFGDLGAGKTTFVQGLAQGMGLGKETYVTSPTFTLVNVYDPLVHVDLYRIEKSNDFETLGLEDYFKSSVVVIEWAEKFQKKMDFKVSIENTEGEERTIEII
jgi:tRNA threonylcarbamoyladenosine biosynthesis protein TsaE